MIIIIFPLLVSTSRPSTSSLDSSISLCCMPLFTATAMPACTSFLTFLWYTLYWCNLTRFVHSNTIQQNDVWVVLFIQIGQLICSMGRPGQYVVLYYIEEVHSIGCYLLSLLSRMSLPFCISLNTSSVTFLRITFFSSTKPLSATFLQSSMS